MTREEAIEYLTILGGIGGITDNEAMALEIAIEALEQEPIIDKIRAEIDNALSDGMIHKKTVLGIIDKYKGESEDKE